MIGQTPLTPGSSCMTVLTSQHAGSEGVTFHVTHNLWCKIGTVQKYGPQIIVIRSSLVMHLPSLAHFLVNFPALLLCSFHTKLWSPKLRIPQFDLIPLEYGRRSEPFQQRWDVEQPQQQFQPGNGYECNFQADSILKYIETTVEAQPMSF